MFHLSTPVLNSEGEYQIGRRNYPLADRMIYREMIEYTCILVKLNLIA